MVPSINWTLIVMQTSERANVAHHDSTSIGKAVILSSFLLVSLAGNIFVCYCGLRSPRMSAMNSLIVNLSVGELAIACIVIPLKIEREVIGEYFVGGPTVCKLLEYAQSVALGSVTVTHLMISLDRLYAVFYPLSKITRRQAKYMSVFAWCYALLFANPVLYYFMGSKHQPRALLFRCDKRLALSWKDKLYSLIQLWAIFLLPIMIMTMSYFAIVSRLLRPDATNYALEPKTGSREATPDVPANTQRRFTSSLRSNVVPLAKRKSVVMNLIVMTIFIFCFAPLAAFYALETVGNPKTESFEIFSDLACFLALGKLCANPAIYSFFDSNLRDQLCRCPMRTANNSPVRRPILFPGICTRGKLSELNVSKIGSHAAVSNGRNAVYKEPLLKVSSGSTPSPSVPGTKREKLARLICNTRRYRSLGVSTLRSSNI